MTGKKEKGERPILSIIVPVYKVEQYIGACIESILKQTLTDWELILVDDGSPDRSGAICDEYAARDCRIQVLHKENEGVSAARNAALDIASGKYVTFVDSDDEIGSSTTYEENVAILEENSEVDIVQYPHVQIPDNKITPPYWLTNVKIIAFKNSRIRVVHKSNGGVNSARNIGVKMARGRYIAFVDADDYVKADTFKKAIEALNKNRNVDLLQYPEWHINNGTETIWNGYPRENRIITDKREMMACLIGSHPTIPGGLWGKLYNRRILLATYLREDMRFCEDMVMMPKIMERCRAIMIITEGGYCYAMRQGSVSHSSYTAKQCLDESRFRMVMLETAIKYNIEKGVWWNKAVLSQINAWASYGPCEELKERLHRLKQLKGCADEGCSHRMIVSVARWFSPMIAARAYRAALKLQGK